MKKAIILLLYQTDNEVSKDTLAHYLGPYQSHHLLGIGSRDPPWTLITKLLYLYHTLQTAWIYQTVGLVKQSRCLKYCFFARHHTNLKNPHTNRFCMVTPIVSSKYWHLYQFCYVKVFSTNQDRNLVMLDDPGRVKNQITSVVCQI